MAYFVFFFSEAVRRKTGADVKQICNFFNKRLKYASAQCRKAAVENDPESSSESEIVD